MGLIVAFRVDAGRKIGLGHVSRMLSLSKAMVCIGAKIIWISRGLPKNVVSVLSTIGAEIFTLPKISWGSFLKPYWRADADQTSRVLLQIGAPIDLLVVDHYGLDAKWEARLRPFATRILAIDDLADRPHDCDVLIDPTAGRRPQVYVDLVPPHCMVCTGADYALVDPEYARLRTRAIAERQARQGTVKKIFISFGGTDGGNATSKAIQALDRCGFSGYVDVVLGEYAPHKTSVRRLLKQTFPEASLHIAPRSPARLIADSDLGIGATGTMSWERCTVGLPAVVLSIAPNQREVAYSLSEAGAVRSLGVVSEVSVDALAEAIGGVLKDRDRVARMSERASALCDGLGVMRAVLELFPMRANDGRSITLRLAKRSDLDQLYKWQTDPSTRKFARNPKQPTYQEHCDWFEKKLKEPTCILHIITYDDTPAGVLRLDAFEAQDAFEISIFVDPACKRRGIAQAALDALRCLIPWATFYAWVHTKNTASHRLFERAGFIYGKGRYISRPTWVTASPNSGSNQGGYRHDIGVTSPGSDHHRRDLRQP